MPNIKPTNKDKILLVSNNKASINNSDRKTAANMLWKCPQCSTLSLHIRRYNNGKTFLVFFDTVEVSRSISGRTVPIIKNITAAIIDKAIPFKLTVPKKILNLSSGTVAMIKIKNIRYNIRTVFPNSMCCLKFPMVFSPQYFYIDGEHPL